MLVLGALLAPAPAAQAAATGAGEAAATPPAPTATPLEDAHDHEPRHGGVVGMAGSRHVEAAALAGGVLRFYLTDFARTPIPLDGVRGTATLRRASGEAQRLDLVTRDGALEARGARFADEPVDVRLDATLAGERLLIDFTLPVTAPAAAGGAAR